MFKYIWLVPFLSFLAGYFIMTTIYKERVLETPNLIGLSVQEALVRINTADTGLGIRLIAEKEHAELPSGTIIEQSPKPQTKIKSHQHIACIVSKAPSTAMPLLIGKKTKDIKQELDDRRMNGKIYYMVSREPIGTCIAQDPAPNTPISSAITATLYLSKGTAEAYTLPDLTGTTSRKAQDMLASHGITTTVTHVSGDHEGPCSNTCIIVEQRPKPGTILQPNADHNGKVYVTVTRQDAQAQALAPDEDKEHDQVQPDS